MLDFRESFKEEEVRATNSEVNQITYTKDIAEGINKQLVNLFEQNKFSTIVKKKEALE